MEIASAFKLRAEGAGIDIAWGADVAQLLQNPLPPGGPCWGCRAGSDMYYCIPHTGPTQKTFFSTSVGSLGPIQ